MCGNVELLLGQCCNVRLLLGQCGNVVFFVCEQVLSTRIKYQGRLYRNMMSIDKSSSDWDKQESKKLEAGQPGDFTNLYNI